MNKYIDKTNQKILLSISCITYNQEPYIRQCIDGFLMQKTTFNFEIIIYDDASTDNTAIILHEYVEKYPKLIIPIFQKINQVSRGINPFSKFVFPKCIGKYIAICEGDDYWTDPYKLQKQVDFFEANEDFVICFHNAIVYNEEEKKEIFEQPGIEKNTIFTLLNFFESNPIATASVVFRSKYIEQIPDWFSKSPFGDYALYLLILMRSQQKTMYLKDVMSVYRIHSQGIHGKAHLSNARTINAYKEHLMFWKVIKKHLVKNQFRKEVNKTVANDYSLIIHYLLKENNYRSALRYNTNFLFTLHFIFLKTNIKLYIRIIKNMVF